MQIYQLLDFVLTDFYKTFRRSMTCDDNTKNVFVSTITNRRYHVINHTSEPLKCSSSNIIYLITCNRCGIQYVGETSQRLNRRMNNHRTSIRNKKNLLLYEHFNYPDGCNLSHLKIQPIEQIVEKKNGDAKTDRLKREAFWIKELRTLTPYGLNDRLDTRNWRFRSRRDDVAGRCFNRLTNVRGSRGKRIKNPEQDRMVNSYFVEYFI